MCGIAGFWQPKNFSIEAARTIAQKMADRIIHRGPDDAGLWMDDNARIVLAHRRLSILDLSIAGHQPMVSFSGRYVLVFNGEIYNHLEMRQGLGRTKWRGHSDTETLLEGFETWGIEEALVRSVGMFAMALWDRKEKILTLARDRMGEKPLYYGFQNNAFIFGSELKALKAHPDFLGEIDRDVLCLYLRYCYIPSPFSVYKGIYKLLPGHYMQFPLGGDSDGLLSVAPKAYWSLAQVVAKGESHPFTGNEAEATAILDEKLRQAIGLQMVADVPLGVFLSGGVDSSTVAALMQSQSSRPIKTFSIGFNEASHNEAGYAKDVARHLGTEHFEKYVSPPEVRQVISQMGRMYDEPFADSSGVLVFLVSQMARRSVTVSLSGDAGDELFCGYNRYSLVDIWKKFESVPFGVRRSAGHMIKSVPLPIRDGFFQYANKFFALPSNMGEKLDKLSTRLESVDGMGDLYYSLVSGTVDPTELVIGASEPGTWLTQKGLKSQIPDPKLHMMYMDCMTYLPDDILVKLDRAAMANSLETRIPLLDHRIIELAWSLPLSMKMRQGQTKWVLRQVLYKYVPQELIERPKMGFGFPVGEWIRGPLKDWVEELLDKSRLQQEGFFDAGLIRSRWQEHLSGKRNWQNLLWSLLMFQTWLEAEGDNKSWIK